MKKMSVCGKGGSGKSAVVALLAQEFQKRGWRVLIVDSDESNSGLHWMLGFERPPLPLMDFVGGKRSVQKKMWAGFSREQTEPEMSVLAQSEIRAEDLPPDYLVESGESRLVAVGKIHQALEGCACPMGVVAREFLKKLRLADDEVAIVDMEAGVEHFGRGVETSLDAVLVVVEPSLESVNLAQRVKELASGAGANFAGAVLNKIASEQLASTLTAELRDRHIPILGTIRYHQEIVEACLTGQPLELGYCGAEVAKIFDALLGRG